MVPVAKAAPVVRQLDRPEPGQSLLAGSVSIKPQAVEAVPVSEVVVDAEALTQQRLEELWAQVGAELGIGDLLADATVTLGQRNNFTITAQTVLFADQFAQHRTDVMQWLRRQTGLPMMDCKVVARYVEKDALPYSPDEKYRYMLEHNPQLARLRRLFPQIEL